MSNSNGTAGVGAKQAAPKGLELELTLMQQGVNTVLPAAGMPIAGTMVTQKALSAELASDIALYTAVDEAKTQYKNALAALEAQVPTMRARYADLKLAVQNNFGAANPQLAKFGIKPKAARKTQTSEQKALSAAKRKATREARGTTSAKQKAKIVGATPTLTIGPNGTTVTPVGSPTPPNAPVTPAAAAGGSTTPSSG